MDFSPPGSSIRGISQARIPEWVAISFFRGCSQSRDGTHVSCTGRQILYHESAGKPQCINMHSGIRKDSVYKGTWRHTTCCTDFPSPPSSPPTCRSNHSTQICGSPLNQLHFLLQYWTEIAHSSFFLKPTVLLWDVPWESKVKYSDITHLSVWKSQNFFFF